MKTVSILLPAAPAFAASLLDVRGLNPTIILAALSENLNPNDKANIYGTLDPATTPLSVNKTFLGEVTGEQGGTTSSPGISYWPYLLVQRTAGSAPGTFFASGSANPLPLVTPTSQPLPGTGFSLGINLQNFGSGNPVRVGLDSTAQASDVFNLYGTDDPSFIGTSGGELLGQLTGGGGVSGTSLLVRNFQYCYVERIGGSTGTNLLAWGAEDAGSGEASGLALVFQPGGPAAGGPVFTDWPSLAAVGAALAPVSATGLVNVLVDTTFGPATVPAGNYPWLGSFSGRFVHVSDPTTGITLLTLADGVVLPNIGASNNAAANNIHIVSQARTVSPITIGDNDVLIIERGAILSTTGTLPIILAQPGQTPPDANGPTIVLNLGGQIGDPTLGGNNDVGVFPLPGATAGLQIILSGVGAQVANNSLFGPGNAGIFYTSTFQEIGGTAPSQPGITGTFSVLDASRQFLMVYACQALTPGIVNPGGVSYVPIGSSVASFTRISGFRPVFGGLLTFFIVVAAPPAGANPPGSSVTFELCKNNVPIPGASFTIDANAGGLGFAQFISSFAGFSDQIEVRATENGGPLNFGLQDLQVTVQ